MSQLPRRVVWNPDDTPPLPPRKPTTVERIAEDLLSAGQGILDALFGGPEVPTPPRKPAVPAAPVDIVPLPLRKPAVAFDAPPAPGSPDGDRTGSNLARMAIPLALVGAGLFIATRGRG